MHCIAYGNDVFLTILTFVWAYKPLGRAGEAPEVENAENNNGVQTRGWSATTDLAGKTDKLAAEI